MRCAKSDFSSFSRECWRTVKSRIICRRVKSPEKRRSGLGQLANHESTSANADTWLGKPLALGLALFYLAMRALKPGHGASGAARIVVDTALIFTMYHACLMNWGHWVRLFAEGPLSEETSEAGAHVEWLLTVRAHATLFTTRTCGSRAVLVLSACANIVSLSADNIFRRLIPSLTAAGPGVRRGGGPGGDLDRRDPRHAQSAPRRVDAPKYPHDLPREHRTRTPRGGRRG